MRPPARLLTSLFALVTLATASPLLRAAETAWQKHGPLKVSENHRFLVHRDGAPFFYLGDTAWEIFHRLTREEAEQYLKTRAEQGFNVIQAVALAEFNGLEEPNAYGQKPLLNNDPTKPDVREGAANDYWDHVDFVVAKAAELGLVIGFLPTWGDKWNKKWGQGPEVFTPANAEQYGRWLGERYKDKPIIWILGGDRPVESPAHAEIIRAMARGLKAGDGGTHLITFHPNGGHGSSEWFHDEPWLDFNMRQNGHNYDFTGKYEKMRGDYAREPAKPVVDGEPLYEGHPIAFKAKENGHSIAADVRRALYWDLFQGAFGHTYGHHSIWQFWAPERKPVNDPLWPWTKAVLEPGARQMIYGRRLMESRPFLTRIPDDEVIVPDRVASAVPGAGTRRFVATRDREGSYLMVYAPISRVFTVRTSVLKGDTVRGWWYNPRNGAALDLGRFPKKPEQEFTPPNAGEAQDWILVLDDAAKDFPAPGAAGR